MEESPYGAFPIRRLLCWHARLGLTYAYAGPYASTEHANTRTPKDAYAGACAATCIRAYSSQHTRAGATRVCWCHTRMLAPAVVLRYANGGRSGNNGLRTRGCQTP
eukprot:3739705-Rhodomonas_salina.2